MIPAIVFLLVYFPTTGLSTPIAVYQTRVVCEEALTTISHQYQEETKQIPRLQCQAEPVRAR